MNDPAVNGPGSGDTGEPLATPDAYFAQQWARGDDPWEHGSRWYETRKYRLTVAAAPRQRYRRAFEPGCGAGFLTALLAERVDELVAMERAPTGVAATRRRCADLPGVEVVEGRIPTDWPVGAFDLIVLSEVLYYLADDDLDAVIDRARSSLVPGGHLVVVHFRRPVAEHARLGDDVHDRVRAVLDAPIVRHVEDDFVLEVFATAERHHRV